MSRIDIFFSILINLTYILSGIWGISHFLDFRKNFKFNLLISAVLCIIQAFVIFVGVPILNTLTALLLIFITTLICFRCDRKVFIVYDILIFISSFIADVFSTICFSVTSRNTIISVLNQQDITTARRILDCIFIFVLCSISFTLIKKKQSSPVWYETIFYIMLAIGEMFSTYFMVINIQDDSSGGFIILFLSGCFLLDIYIAFMFNRISVVREAEKENALLQQQAEIQMSVYQDLQNRYERSMKIIHDAKKHVTALEGLIQSENIEEATEYKKSLYQEFDRLQLSFQNKNKILTVIINNELIKAENHDIEMKLIIDESFVDFVDNGDSLEQLSLISSEILETYSDGLFVIKSISKSYGIPGARLGVLASADRKTIRTIKEELPIWNINSFGEFYMQIAGKYRKEYVAAINKIRQERIIFAAELENISFVRVIPSQANYIMCELINGTTSIPS